MTEAVLARTRARHRRKPPKAWLIVTAFGLIQLGDVCSRVLRIFIGTADVRASFALGLMASVGYFWIAWKYIRAPFKMPSLHTIFKREHDALNVLIALVLTSIGLRLLGL